MGSSFSRTIRNNSSARPSPSADTRFIKNSSKFDVKIARNLARSSKGVRSSRASARTRRLKSNQLRSRSIHTSDNPTGRCALSTPRSPIEARAVAAIRTSGDLPSAWHHRTSPTVKDIQPWILEEEGPAQSEFSVNWKEGCPPGPHDPCAGPLADSNGNFLTGNMRGGRCLRVGRLKHLYSYLPCLKT